MCFSCVVALGPVLLSLKQKTVRRWGGGDTIRFVIPYEVFAEMSLQQKGEHNCIRQFNREYDGVTAIPSKEYFEIKGNIELKFPSSIWEGLEDKGERRKPLEQPAWSQTWGAPVFCWRFCEAEDCRYWTLIATSGKWAELYVSPKCWWPRRAQCSLGIGVWTSGCPCVTGLQPRLLGTDGAELPACVFVLEPY